MNGGAIKEVWDKVDLNDQHQVNDAIRTSMIFISPAVEKVWWLNVKVNVLYAVIGFSAVAAGITIGILQLCK